MAKIVEQHCTGNKLQLINSTIGVYEHFWSLSRRDAVITHRLRIGHTQLTHSYLLSVLINRSVRLVIPHWQSSTF